MKNILFLIAIAMLFVGCENPVTEIITPISLEEQYANDPRLSAVGGAEDAVWVAYPRQSSSSRSPGEHRVIIPGNGQAVGINHNPNVIAQCVESGWGYIFYDDEAVIGYEPFPDSIELMHRAVAITVELHNRDFPDESWGYINVSPPPPPPPNTENDPILAKWQWALVLDDGTIVRSYQCESLEEFTNFKRVDPWYRALILDLEIYNRDNDPDAHIVWGPEEDAPPEGDN